MKESSSTVALVDEESEETGGLITLSDLRIRTKQKTEVPFEPNDVQRRYLNELIPDWENALFARDGPWQGIGQGHREILLKARQFGFSTLILALFFLDTVNRGNTKTVVIAHDSESTEGLFRIVKRFYDRLPDGIRPDTKYSNRREMLFKRSGSSFSVMTAGTKTSGRSSTIDNLHCSEVAFWPNPEVLTGLLQAVTPDGNLFQETTANGEGNAYWEAYQAAKSGESLFNARFFAWFDHTGYQAEPPADFVRDDDEEKLREVYALTDAQLYWRRRKRHEPGMGNLFRQEYPANDTEAFAVSGAKYFTQWEPGQHVVDEVAIQPYWKLIGGLDWGHYSPFCFLLAAIDDDARVFVIDEVYRIGLPNAEQAAEVLRCIEKWTNCPAAVQIAADPSMWAQKTVGGLNPTSDIDWFHAKKLNCVRAHNARVAGWNLLRHYLAEPGSLAVHEANCPHLIRTIPVMKHDTVRPEDLDSTLEDHAVDALRYLLQHHVSPSKRPDDAGGARTAAWQRARVKPRLS